MKSYKNFISNVCLFKKRMAIVLVQSETDIVIYKFFLSSPDKIFQVFEIIIIFLKINL